MIQKVSVEEFLSLAQHYPVLDVRSPGEYNHAHIPGAYNLPLFSDEERKVVGTLYKQQSREDAIKAGLDFFGVKMRKMVETTEAIIASSPSVFKGKLPPAPANCLLVHCWRGGMRSAGVAWLLDLYGFKVCTLIGGYKAFRNYILQQFEKPYSFNVVGGYTGSGKTKILHQLAKSGHCVLDLENIASHKGSAFGALGEGKQPVPEMFENILALKLASLSLSLPAGHSIWVEDESRRIGDLNLPKPLWETMRQSQVYFLEVPFEVRLDYLTAEYGAFKKDELVNSIMRIRKRLGSLAAKNAIGFLLEDNHKECFRILLKYYDKFYGHDLHDRGNVQMHMVPCGGVDTGKNAQQLLNKTIPA